VTVDEIVIPRVAMSLDFCRPFDVAFDMLISDVAV